MYEVAKIVPSVVDAHGKYFYIYDTNGVKYRVRVLYDGFGVPTPPIDGALACDAIVAETIKSNDLMQAIAHGINMIGGVETGLFSSSPVDSNCDGVIEELQIGPVAEGPTEDIEAGNSGWYVEVLQQGE